MSDTLELGLDTFGDVTLDRDGRPHTQARVLRDVVEEAVLADRVGLHFFGVGEHHRADFAVSAPEVLLAAIAGRTTQIHLGSAVTVLSSDDPVRVFQRFSTLNAISNGRAEVILGRGSFTESFPLFGYDLSRYEELFEDKLELFAELLKPEPVTWTGRTRTPLRGQIIYPPIEPGEVSGNGTGHETGNRTGNGAGNGTGNGATPGAGMLRTWVGVGGSPDSIVRAARYGLPLMLAIISGSPQRFAPLVELYHRLMEQAGHPAQPIGAHSPGHVAATDEQAKEELWPHYFALMNRIGRERGWSPIGRAHFEREAGPDGALFVGSPETVAAKIVSAVRHLGLSRFDMKYSNGTLAHDKLMSSIELYGTQVVPRVRERLQS